MNESILEQKIIALENQLNELQEQYEQRIRTLEKDYEERQPIYFDTKEEHDQYLREILAIWNANSPFSYS